LTAGALEALDNVDSAPSDCAETQHKLKPFQIKSRPACHFFVRFFVNQFHLSSFRPTQSELHSGHLPLNQLWLWLCDLGAGLGFGAGAPFRQRVITSALVVHFLRVSALICVLLVAASCDQLQSKPKDVPLHEIGLLLDFTAFQFAL
jgi:hypothetical protein